MMRGVRNIKITRIILTVPKKYEDISRRASKSSTRNSLCFVIL